jgi:glycosyltransferase involved in cell wall biosynthesis
MLIIKIIKKIYKIFNLCIFNIFVTVLFIYFNNIKYEGKENAEKSILLFAGFNKYGGTRTYVKNLITVLEKYNLQVYLILNKRNISADGLALLKDSKYIYYKYNYSFDNPFIMFMSIIHINKIIKNNDINTTIISEGDCGYYLPCTLFKTQNILIEHSVPGKIENYKKRIINKTKSNTRIICVSNFQKEKTLESWGKYLNDYCFVIYNSGSFELNFLLKNNYNLKKRRIITAAHFIDYKNPDMWLSIAKKLTEKYTEVEFRWIGNGDELLHYQNTVNKNNAIKLLGYCNYEQIIEEYKNAFLYLALSKIESLGIAVIDALHAGLPAIVLSTGGLPEVVDSEKCGFIVSSEEEAVEKIELLLKDQELYCNMSKNAIDRYNMLFSKTQWENNIISMIYLPPPPPWILTNVYNSYKYFANRRKAA